MDGDSLLALPVAVCEGTEGGGDYGDSMTFSGLMVYRVDVESGFEFVGGVPHETPVTESFSCNNWWTRSNSQVKRSIFMDDFVYSVALDKIDIAHLDDLAQPIANVSLAD